MKCPGVLVGWKQIQDDLQAKAKQRKAKQVVVDLLEMSLRSANKAQIAINHMAMNQKFTILALTRQRDAVEQSVSGLTGRQSAAALRIAVLRYRHERSRMKEVDAFRQRTARHLETLVSRDS